MGRRYVVILKSKPDSVRYDVQRTVRTGKAIEDSRFDRFLLVPKYERQAAEFRDALERIWRMGGFTTYADELFYLSERLRLESPIERLLTQGRSKGISVAIGMQRPARISRFAISESTHVLSFGLEGRDAKELSYATTRGLEVAVQQLREHEFVWFRRPRTLWIGRLDIRSGELHGDYI